LPCVSLAPTRAGPRTPIDRYSPRAIFLCALAYRVVPPMRADCNTYIDAMYTSCRRAFGASASSTQPGSGIGAARGESGNPHSRGISS
jgi:hypothetical protein